MSTSQPTGSIRRRLVMQLAIIAALLSLAFFFTVRFVAEQAATDTQDNILAASATSIADAVYSEGGSVRLELPYSALSMLGTISEDRVFYRVIVDGTTLTGYEDLPISDAPVGSRSPLFETMKYRGDNVRTAAVSRTLSTGIQSKNVLVIVGQTRLGLAAISSRITTTATAVGVGFFLFAMALSAFAAQNALSPLNKLAESVARRGPNDLRPVVTRTPSELVPLVNGLNGFMLRLRDALTRSEDLIAEAAHRIRTPLATVRTQAEVIHRQMERPKNRSSVREMIRAVDESSRSAGQLLDHAMVTFRSDQLETREIDPKELLHDVVDRLSPTAELKDIHIHLELPDDKIMIRGDPILLQNAVRNILDNAIKYSPDETEIIVRLTSTNPCLIDFIDQGRGFANADMKDLTRRFSRGTNVTDIVGSGLGLTIADDVARAHGGKLLIGSNKNGIGACVSLVLPLS
ncbi:MAG: sensor histidine kinase N-terminal domain-containing protein [Rhizobiaceae bacterium]